MGGGEQRNGIAVGMVLDKRRTGQGFKGKTGGGQERSLKKNRIMPWRFSDVNEWVYAEENKHGMKCCISVAFLRM